MLTTHGSPLVIIGHDILALGLAALLRARGARVLVRDGMYEGEVIPAGMRPAAIIVDLLVACRDEFALLRLLRADPRFCDVPILVLSPGTVSRGLRSLEERLRALDVRALLSPHDLDTVVGELERSLAQVA